MIVRRYVLMLALLSAAGCSARSIEPLNRNHPASPAAAESPAAPESTTLKVIRAPNKPSAQTPDEPAGRPVTRHAADYRCPMHPEVRSDKPGRCPKCGMTLQRDGGSQ